jgi:hypothetical protein
MYPFPLGFLALAGGAAVMVGGTEVDYNGYRYHIFASTSTLTVNTDTACDVFVVAGGGAGGAKIAGQGADTGSAGGGAGGVREVSVTLIAGSYTAAIGAGGSAGTSSSNPGSNSTLSGPMTISATGGGIGARNIVNSSRTTTMNGGSGGGESPGSGQVGLGNQGGYTPVEGYDGGNGSSANGGGGGGAGISSDGDSAGYGLLKIDYANASGKSFDGGYFGGGGGGSGSSAVGGLGGGGDTNYQTSSGSGSTNSGGGGSGIRFISTSAVGPGGYGGSGILMVRYVI